MSFRLKTILGIALIEATLLFVLILMMLNFIEKGQNRELLDRAVTTINLFTSAAREPFFASDLAKLESLTSEILENPGIVYVKIIDSDTSVVEEAGNQEALNKPFKEDASLKQALQDNIFDISRNILIDDFILGTVQLGISTESVVEDIALIKKYGLSVAGIEMLLITFLSFGLGTWLTRQLITLKNAAETIEKGDLGHQVAIRGRDEIALTAQAFNSMSKRLQETENLQQETMQQLEVAEEHSRLLLTSAGEGIFGIDHNKIISFANPEAAHLLGFKSSEDLIGINASDLFNNNPSILQNLNHCVENSVGIKVDDEALHIEKNSSIKIEYTCSPIRKNEEISGSVIIFNDISQRKEAEAAITKAHFIALENAQAKADFMANISHELRTPMHGVIGLLQLINKDSLSEDYAEYISTAQKSADKLMQLIDDILDFSKIDSGKMELINIDFEAEKLIKECIDKNIDFANKKGLDLNLDFSSPIKWLKGDPQRLQKIVNNLIDNAIKFTPEGSITVSVYLIEKSDDYAKLEFSIKDTGIGISKNQQNKLFNSFQQLDTSLTREHGGAGLGLAISKSLVEMMDGIIRVVSEKEQGSEFIFNVTFEISSIQESQTAMNN